MKNFIIATCGVIFGYCLGSILTASKYNDSIDNVDYVDDSDYWDNLGSEESCFTNFECNGTDQY